MINSAPEVAREVAASIARRRLEIASRCWAVDVSFVTDPTSLPERPASAAEEYAPTKDGTDEVIVVPAAFVIMSASKT